MKNKIGKVIIYILPCLLLMFLTMYHIEDNALPKIFGDEYGYWAAGAYFAGLDWHEITSLNDYYGWGYGIFLSFILRLSLSSELCYKIAIGLNGVFLCAIYIIALKLSEEIVCHKYKLVNAAVAFAAAIMPSTLYYTQYTMAEVFITLCYWCIVYFAWKILIYNSWIYEILSLIHI